MKVWIKKYGCIMAVVFFSSMALAGCIMKKEPVKVGFSATLTGKQAEVGVQTRNGIQLALDKINATGGVAGRPIELVVRDDLGTKEGAKEVDRQLIDSGVVGIIGHGTSTQTVEGLTVTEPAHVVLLGAVVSSPEFTGKYQYFLRVYPAFSEGAKMLARHVYQKRNLSKVAIIYDTTNATFSNTYKNIFMEQYQAVGGIVTSVQAFSSLEKTDFTLLAEKARESKAEGVMLIATDEETAVIAQKIRLIGWTAPLFGSSWAPTATLINNGGRAVEGMELEHAYAYENQEASYLEFVQQYTERYGDIPSFGAAFGYEAALVMAVGLEKSGGKAEGLREALLSIKDFKGIVDTFSFDKNGDVIRPFYLSVIRDGKFVIVDKLSIEGK